jgi:hypothetical protein
MYKLTQVLIHYCKLPIQAKKGFEMFLIYPMLNQGYNMQEISPPAEKARPLPLKN